MTLQLLDRQQEKPDRASGMEEPGAGAAKQEEARADPTEPVQHSPAQAAAPPAGPGAATTGSTVSDQDGESAPLPAGPRTPEEEQVTQSNGVSEQEKVQGKHLSCTTESILDPKEGPVLAGQPVAEVEGDFLPGGQRQGDSPAGEAGAECSLSRAALHTEVAEPSALEAKPGEAGVAACPEQPVAEQEAEEPGGGPEPPPPLSGEGGSCTDPLDGASSEAEPAPASSTTGASSAITRDLPAHREPCSSPSQKNSRWVQCDCWGDPSATLARQRTPRPELPLLGSVCGGAEAPSRSRCWWRPGCPGKLRWRAAVEQP